jgi:hypothetical protein
MVNPELALGGFLKWDRFPRRSALMKNAVLAGLCTGIGTVFRPEAPLILVACLPVVLWVFLRRGLFGKGLRACALAMVVCGVVLLPWTIRNAVTLHEFQPLTPKYTTMPGELVPAGFMSWERTWLYRVAHNHVLDELRREKRDQRYLAEVQEDYAQQEVHDDVLRLLFVCADPAIPPARCMTIRGGCAACGRARLQPRREGTPMSSKWLHKLIAVAALAPFLGGFAMAASPAIVQFVGGTPIPKLESYQSGPNGLGVCQEVHAALH